MISPGRTSGAHSFDRVGRRASILFASLLFVTTAICGAMPGFSWNLLMCLMMGIAAGGMLPIAFGKTHAKTRAPWVAIVVLATGWALCLGLGFERLVTLDIILYGASLMLEFVTLVVLRIREVLSGLISETAL